MNLLSFVILGIILFLAFLAISYIAHTKDTNGCSGNCSQCQHFCKSYRKKKTDYIQDASHGSY